MEINQEALEDLSIADLIALRNYHLEAFIQYNAPKHNFIQLACFKELNSRVDNIFIF